MSIYDLQLCKGGNLLLKEWDSEQNIYVEKQLDPEDFVFFINSTICLEKNLTLKDFFILMDRDMEYFSLVSACPILVDLISECLYEKKFENVEQKMVYLELRKNSFLEEEDEEYKKYLSTNIEFSGVNNSERYAIEFIPLNVLGKLPLILNEEIELKYIKEDVEVETVCTFNEKFTLFELVNGIVEELSFAGPPVQKNVMMEKIKDSLKQIDKGEVSVFDMEDFQRQLALEIEKHKVPCRVCGKDARSQHFKKPDDLCYSCFLKLKEN
jgi:hypothetical protein